MGKDITPSARPSSQLGPLVPSDNLGLNDEAPSSTPEGSSGRLQAHSQATSAGVIEGNPRRLYMVGCVQLPIGALHKHRHRHLKLWHLHRAHFMLRHVVPSHA